jgi:plasmid stabilization system protein ParE
MATVIWTDKAKAARRKLYVEGVINFGIFTALKVVRKIESITDELEYFPELGYREPLLEGKKLKYRACHINKRFKIIYWFDKVKDKVIIEDIWDVHRAPQNLRGKMMQQ